MTMKPANIFQSLPQDLTNEVFETLLQSKDIKIERIISKGHSSPESDWYDQEQGEWVILLKGEARIVFEGEEEITLSPGDHINIPAHKKHRVSWTDPERETVWLAVFYN